MPIIDLLQTETFRDWFNKTNEIINALNANTLIAGATASGTFVVNGSIQVLNTFSANATVVALSGNTVVTGNTVVSANVWNFAGNSLLIQPLSGTTVNSPMTFTAAAPVMFSGGVSANANVSITADVLQTGNTVMNGTFTSNAGPAIVRQVLMASANAIVAVTLASPEFDDFGPAGLNEASILNLTPNIDAVLTGIAQPTNFAVGGRVLYIQNLSPTYNITLVSANNNSGVTNRFKFPNDSAVVITPGSAVSIMWTSVNKQWRGGGGGQITSLPTLTVSGPTTLTGNVSIGGTLSVAGNTTLNAVAVVSFVSGVATTGNLTVTGWATISSTLGVTGNASFGGTLAVSSNTFLTGLTAFQAVNCLSTLDVTAKATLHGALEVGGATQLDAALQVSGATTMTTLLAGNSQFAHIGVGTAADPNAVALFAGQYLSPLVNKGSLAGPTQTINWNDGTDQYFAAMSPITLTFTNPIAGGRYVLVVYSAGNVISWPGSIHWGITGAPPLGVNGKYDLYTFFYLGSGVYLGAYNQGY